MSQHGLNRTAKTARVYCSKWVFSSVRLEDKNKTSSDVFHSEHHFIQLTLSTQGGRGELISLGYGGDNSISKWHITTWSSHWHNKMKKDTPLKYAKSYEKNRVRKTLKHWITIAIWSCHWEPLKETAISFSPVNASFSHILTLNKAQITFCKSNNHASLSVYTTQMHIYTTIITYLNNLSQ